MTEVSLKGSIPSAKSYGEFSSRILQESVTGGLELVLCFELKNEPNETNMLVSICFNHRIELLSPLHIGH